MEYFPKQFISAGEERTTREQHVNAPYFRKKFRFQKGSLAKVRICGLGFYELYVNGKNITKGPLAPYITNPDQALYYDDYDLTELLEDGDNVLGVWLGNGMQNAAYGNEWKFDVAPFASAPKFALALWVDGELTLETDESFLTKPSPITFDDLRAGERYDARLEIPGWSTPLLDDSDWQNAVLAVTPKGEPKIVEAEPIAVQGTLKPVSVTKTPKGAYLYDFGVNFTGVCRLQIQGERGQKVRLTHGEVVIDGELDVRNIVICFIGLREGYDQCDEYILKGEGVETYTPRFTYHGFQYVSVEGITEEQAKSDLLTFEIWHNDVKKVGDFSCSDEVANILQESVQRSDLSNLFYVPTDCPHREKNGWTGDVALSAEQMLLNFSVDKVFADWLFSVRKAQDGRGAIPGIVPTGGWGFEWGAGPAWDDVLIETPYQMYRYTGEKKYVLDNLAEIGIYLRYMKTKKNADGLMDYGLPDWAQPRAETISWLTPLEVTDSIKCIDICEKIIKLATLVGEEALVDSAKALAEELRIAFQKKYVQDGKLTIEQQTALAYVLYYDLCGADRKKVEQQLVDCIHRDGDVFTTGVLGARVLFRVLTEMGEGELAYRLITQDKFPSYGYHVHRGLHTLAERFFLLHPTKWLKEDGSNHDSFNHHFWGDISAWFISYVAGIKINPTFFAPDSVVIAPDFLPQLSYAQAEYLHRRGRIFSRWERAENGDVTLMLKLPEGVEASLCLPYGYACDTSALRSGEQKIVCKKL